MRSLIIRRTLYIPAAATRSRWTPTQHPFILSAVAIAVVGMMLFQPTHRASMCRKRSARQAFTHCRSLFTIRISLIRTCIYTWIGVRVMHTTLHSHIYQHVYSIKTKKREKLWIFIHLFPCAVRNVSSSHSVCLARTIYSDSFARFRCLWSTKLYCTSKSASSLVCCLKLLQTYNIPSSNIHNSHSYTLRYICTILLAISWSAFTSTTIPLHIG